MRSRPGSPCSIGIEPGPGHDVEGAIALDDTELPLFDAGSLRVEFADNPEGPRGVSLIRLVCGLRGQPLPPAAVERALAADRALADLLARVLGAVEGDNVDRLLALAGSGEATALQTAAPAVAIAEGLISMRRFADALVVWVKARERFPKAVRLRQLEGLALRRLDRFREATDVLSELEAAGHQDPETLGILAAAWDGLYQQTHRTQQLRTSRELYRIASAAHENDHDTGVNAASKSLFLGESEEAERLARRVLPLVAAAPDSDFWALCTRAEVKLLTGDVAGAAADVQRAIDRNPGRRGDLVSTRHQATRICAALGASEEDARRVLSPFALLDDRSCGRRSAVQAGGRCVTPRRTGARSAPFRRARQAGRARANRRPPR